MGTNHFVHTCLTCPRSMLWRKAKLGTWQVVKSMTNITSHRSLPRECSILLNRTVTRIPLLLFLFHLNFANLRGWPLKRSRVKRRWDASEILACHYSYHSYCYFSSLFHFYCPSLIFAIS